MSIDNNATEFHDLTDEEKDVVRGVAADLLRSKLGTAAIRNIERRIKTELDEPTRTFDWLGQINTALGILAINPQDAMVSAFQNEVEGPVILGVTFNGLRIQVDVSNGKVLATGLQDE